MHDPRRFRQTLLLRILGVTSAALAGVGCGTSENARPTLGQDANADHANGKPDAGRDGGRAVDAGADARPPHDGSHDHHDAITTGDADGGRPADARDDGTPDATIDSGPDAAIDAPDDARIDVDAAQDASMDGDGNAPGPPTTLCFAWPGDAGADAGPCPADSATVYSVFESAGCPRGIEPGVIVSGPTDAGTPTTCCYVVELVTCGPGGRPYLADGHACLAEPRRGSATTDWRAGEAPNIDGLAMEARSELAEAWTRAALFEHASIASFARFSLELMAAAAPANLVERAHTAALDEVAHARACFALASRYAGTTVSPGPFPLGDTPPAGDLATLAVHTAIEGCVGETIAALVASEQLARTVDAAVATALTRIAEDEARHAELAWETVAWALRAGGAEVEEAVRRAFTETLAMSGEHASRGVARARAGLERHGILDATVVAEIAVRAMQHVITPAVAALFARRGTYTHRHEPPIN